MSGAPFQLFPALPAATEAALTESIRRWGVLVPVVRDQHGNILDGHHRVRIADQLGVTYRVDVLTVDDERQAREIAATLNADRRQLDPEQRREIVGVLREQGHSLRAIAGAVGASHTQVKRDVEAIGTDVPIDRVQRQGGGTYPAKRPTVVAAKNVKEADKAQQALADADVPAGRVLDVKRVERIAREQHADRRRQEPVEPVTTDEDIVIVHGDLADALDSQDLVGGTIITDPPYPREFLPVWGALAEAGLYWGCGRLVAMSGQALLPEVLDQVLSATHVRLTDGRNPVERWRYRWCGAYLTAGPATRVWNANVGTSWKPILVFDRGDDDRPFLTTDVFRSDGDDKQHHHWGQAESGIARLVEAFTQPGDLVVDPFLGGGTTAVVCKRLGRRFIGCDIDAGAVQTTRERLAA